ncbi:extracellular solute-binding protein [Enterococcus sp.]|uniref:extracellular solute-binding protein n=1 Tax=Enterococcus sp. TaxID=35783 RepID=UPI002FC90556
MKKRNVISLVMLASCIALVACGNKESKGEEVVSQIGKVSPDPRAAYEETLTATMIIEDPFGKVKSPYTDTAWGKAYKEDLNMNVDVKAVIASSNYTERLNTLIASDDLPDFFKVPSNMLEQLIEDEMLEDITDIYDEYASDRIKTYSEANGKRALLGSMVDGKMYGVPIAGNEQASRNVIMMRKDWLDKLDLEVPETIDDVWEVAEAFKENKLGGANTIGIPMDKSLGQVNAIVSAYGANKGIYTVTDDGKLEYSSTSPEMKKALEVINEKFEDGIIDPEFIAKDGDKVNEDLKAGKAGIWFSGTGANAGVIEPVLTSTPEAEFVAVPIRKSDGTVANQEMPTSAGSFWVVKKGAKNPEALLKLMNYTIDKWDSLRTLEEFATYNYNTPTGQEGFHGFPIGGIPEATLRWPVQLKHYKETGEYSDDVDPEEETKIQNVIKYEEEGTGTPTQLINAWETSPVGPGVALGEYAAGDHYAYNYNQGFGSPTMKVKQSILDKIELDNFMGIITGNQPIETFDKYVVEWKENGGDQIVQELNEWFAANPNLH